MRSSRREFDAEALIRAMVFNRLCDPGSNLGCLRWLETVAIPSMPDTVTHQLLLRAIELLIGIQENPIFSAHFGPTAGRKGQPTGGSGPESPLA